MGVPARETGSATTQTVVVFPAVVLLVMLVLQFALWRHAGHVVTAAAQEGAARAQAERGSAAAGREAARRFLDRAGRGLVEGVRVTATRDGARAGVRVEGVVVSLVPGFRLTVTGTADGPSERFRPPAER